MKLKGLECPKLFDKWQPLEFCDFNLDNSGKKYEDLGRRVVNQNYTFPFGYVEINFDYNQYCTQKIAATQLVPNENYTNVPFIFNKDILDLYYDAKNFTQEKINSISKIIPELSDLVVDKYSRFQRAINFEYSVNVPFENVDLRNQTAIEIYLSLKEHLFNVFSKDKEFFHPGNVMGFQ